MVRKITMIGTGLCLLAVLVMTSAWNSAVSQDDKACIRVGIYDSRGVAIAFGNSDYNERILQPRMKEYEKAKEKGNEKKMKELETWFEERQHQAHLQAFCGKPVDHLLDPIRDRIPEIAKEAGVELIVSKWQIDYQAKDIELVDVTKALAKAYDPKEKVWKWIDDLKNHDLVPVEALEKHKH